MREELHTLPSLVDLFPLEIWSQKASVGRWKDGVCIVCTYIQHSINTKYTLHQK